MRSLALSMLVLTSCSLSPGVHLTVEFASNVSKSALASVREFDFVGGGDDDGHMDARTVTDAARKSAILYRPASTSRSITIAVTAKDGAGNVIASGSTGMIDVTPSQGQSETITLASNTLADMGMTDMTSEGDAAMAPCTVYVATSGTLAGHQAHTTFQAALGVLVPGDVLCVASETYNENLNVSISGTATMPIVIRAYDPTSHPIVDGQYLLPNDGPDDAPCSEVGTNPTANEGPAPNQACYSSSPLVAIDASYVVWTGIDVTHSRGRGLTVNTSGASMQRTNVTIEGSEISHCRFDGLFVSDDTNVIVRGNSLHDLSDYLVYDDASATRGSAVVIDGSDHVTIVDNTCFHIYGIGIEMGLVTMTTNITVQHDTIYDSIGPYIDGNDTSSSLIDANLVYDTHDGSWFNGTDTADGITLRSYNTKQLDSDIVSNNIVYGCPHLIALRQGVSGSLYSNLGVYGNTLLQPRTGAVYDDMQSLSGGVLVDNLIVATTQTASDMFVGTGITLSHNLWTADQPSGLAGAGDVVSAQAGLVSQSYVPTAGTFDTSNMKLTAGSPAIDHGATEPISTDFFGNARPKGNGYDIGAVEMQ